MIGIIRDVSGRSTNYRLLIIIALLGIILSIGIAYDQKARALADAATNESASVIQNISGSNASSAAATEAETADAGTDINSTANNDVSNENSAQTNTTTVSWTPSDDDIVHDYTACKKIGEQTFTLCTGKTITLPVYDCSGVFKVKIPYTCIQVVPVSASRSGSTADGLDSGDHYVNAYFTVQQSGTCEESTRVDTVVLHIGQLECGLYEYKGYVDGSPKLIYMPKFTAGGNDCLYYLLSLVRSGALTQADIACLRPYFTAVRN